MTKENKKKQCNLHVVSGSSLSDLFRKLTADERSEIVNDDYCDHCWQDERKHGNCYCHPRYDI